MTKRGDGYKLLPLRDALLCLNQKVSFLGVVTEFGLPRKSQGTDYVCTLKIVDESLQTPPMSVNVFALKPEELPNVKSVGDLIQFSRVEMKVYDREPHAIFNKKFSAFALFEGKSSNNFQPYQVSSRFQARDSAQDSMKLLRAWLHNFQLNAGSSEYLLSLKKINQEAKFFDLICKILLVYEGSESERVLIVWDGTDCTPLCLKNKLKDEEMNPLPLQLEPPCLSRDNLCTFPNVGRDNLCTFPNVGTVYRVRVDQECHNCDLSLLRSGEWVRLRNIFSNAHAGLWYGSFTSKSRVGLLSNEDNIVLQRLKDYKERISANCLKLSAFPKLSSVTDIDYGDGPRFTLMNIIMHAEVTAKFKCVVRVVAIHPWRVEEFCSPNTHMYRLRLTLEDATARIHAYVFAEDGEKFFNGRPSVEELKVKRDTLLGVAVNDTGVDYRSPRNPPWVQCCIKSYYLDKDDQWGSRQYRIFGTSITV